MAVAEALYQRGILSYPRTETDFFKDGFDLTTLLVEHRAHPDWGSFACRLVDEPNFFVWPRSGGHDDQAHPPIHPTKSVELASLADRDEQSLYDLVCRHFLACCSRDAVGNSTNITVGIPADSWHSEQFSASGLMVLEKNWLEVYGKHEKWVAKRVPQLKG